MSDSESRRNNKWDGANHTFLSLLVPEIQGFKINNI